MALALISRKKDMAKSIADDSAVSCTAKWSTNVPTYEPRVLSLSDASPEYATQVEKLAGLKARIGADQREIDELHEKKRLNPISDDELARKSRVAKLIGDDGPDDTTADRGRLQELYREVRDLGDAAKLIEGRIREERMRASAIVVEQVRDEYGRLVRAQCEQLVTLLGAMTDYGALTAELESADVAWTALRPMPLGWIGSPHDPQGRAAHFLREAAEHGFFEADKIPPRLRSGGVTSGWK